MRGQIHVDIIQLLAAVGIDGDGDRDKVAVAAATCAYGAFMNIIDMTLDNPENKGIKVGFRPAHNLDRKPARKFHQALPILIRHHTGHISQNKKRYIKTLD